MIYRKLPIRYGYGILIGLAFGILWVFHDYLQAFRMEAYYRWKFYLPVPIINYVFWGILLPVVYYFVDKLPLSKSSNRSIILKAFAASIAVAFFHETITSIIYHGGLHLVDLHKLNQKSLLRIINGYPLALFYRFLEYWVIFYVLTAIDLQQKFKHQQQELAQVEKQLANAQLSAIRGQLQPHFLFNTLNTISSLMDINVKSAQKVVSKLGALFRTVLEKNKRKFIPFEEELSFIRNYLDIEQIRFQDRLEVKYTIDSKAKKILVPNLILQPIIAHAINNGLAKTSGAGFIEILAQYEEEWLKLIIRDNVIRSETSKIDSVEERLKALYNDNFRYLTTTNLNNEFEVHLELPRNSS